MALSKVAIAEAHRLAHPPSLVISLASNTMLCSIIGYDEALGDQSEQVVAVAKEHSFPYWGAVGTMLCGWAKVKKNDLAQGTSLLHRGMTAYRATGAKLWSTYHQLLLAGACDIAGQTDEALILLDDAVQMVQRTGERVFAAELHRHKGQLLLREGHTPEAEALYCKALSIAEEQEAKLWELRAAVSLARLRHDQGRDTEARDILAPVYGWFTEGFGTPDLNEAKALLEALDA